MGMDDNYHRLLDEENMAFIETPLIAPSNSYFRQHYKTALYPYNVTSHAGANYHSQNGHISMHDPELNGDGNGHYNSVEKQSRYLTDQQPPSPPTTTKTENT